MSVYIGAKEMASNILIGNSKAEEEIQVNLSDLSAEEKELIIKVMERDKIMQKEICGQLQISPMENFDNITRFNSDKLSEPEFERNSFSQEELLQDKLEYPSCEDDDTLNEECSDTSVVEKCDQSVTALDCQKNKVSGNDENDCLSSDKTEEAHLQDKQENYIYDPISPRYDLIRQNNIQKNFKNMNYVTVFRDDFNQKVIATPLNKPTPSTLATEDDLLKSKSLEFDLRGTNTLAAQLFVPDIDFIRYEKIFPII